MRDFEPYFAGSILYKLAARHARRRCEMFILGYCGILAMRPSVINLIIIIPALRVQNAVQTEEYEMRYDFSEKTRRKRPKLLTLTRILQKDMRVHLMRHDNICR